MKNWRRKLKNIFNSKGEEKSPRIIDRDSNSMMEKRREHRPSNHRSLPSLPHVNRKQTEFPTTYRDAEDWLVKSQQTIDRALLVIERYPELIKQKSCERLCKFGARVAVSSRNGTNKSTKTLKQTTDAGNEGTESNQEQNLQTDTEDSCVSVPEILVSQAEDDELLHIGNKPGRVFVCGNVDNDLWHHLLVDLCKGYSIRCMSPDDYPECNRWISKTDVFLFLMDDTSAREYPYQDQLRLAVILDLNIVFVRDLGFELKMDHSSNNIYSENSQTTRTHPQNRLRAHIDAASSTNRLHPNTPVERLKCMRLNSTIVDIETNEEPLQHVLCGKISPPPYRHTMSTTEHTERGQQSYSGPEVDVTKITEKEYGTALVYHHLYHSRCLARIISAINSYAKNSFRTPTSVTNSRHSLLTPVSTYSIYSGVSSDSAVSDMYHTMTPEPADQELGHEFLGHKQSLDEVSIQSELSSPTETIYLVYPAVGEEKPKVFHWPKDVEKETIVNSASVDSLGFQDIDLSKRVNEIDVFEGNLSD